MQSKPTAISGVSSGSGPWMRGLLLAGDRHHCTTAQTETTAHSRVMTLRALASDRQTTAIARHRHDDPPSKHLPAPSPARPTRGGDHPWIAPGIDTLSHTATSTDQVSQVTGINGHRHEHRPLLDRSSPAPRPAVLSRRNAVAPVQASTRPANRGRLVGTGRTGRASLRRSVNPRRQPQSQARRPADQPGYTAY